MDTAEYKQKKSEQDRCYREAHKEQIQASNKVYAEKNKEAIKTRRARYKAKNKEIIREKQRQYDLAHKEIHAEKGRLYQEKHKERLAEIKRQQRIANGAAWLAIIKQQHDSFACEICGLKLVFFVAGNGKTPGVIHWDHRAGNEPIKKLPATWLMVHPATPENIALWNQCNFGMLCVNCNVMVGSPENRRERILRMLAYTRKHKI
jgi:hypothetical protein